jgi:hypothetical protein
MPFPHTGQPVHADASGSHAFVQERAPPEHPSTAQLKLPRSAPSQRSPSSFTPFPQLTGAYRT